MFKDEYRKTFEQVAASQEVYDKLMLLPQRKKHSNMGRLGGKVLLAAILLGGLAVTVSAAESILGWFTQYFGGRDNLSQQQVQYLEERTQSIPTEPMEAMKNPARTDALQFIEGEVDIQVDINNTHLTGTGEANYQTVRLHSLVLTETDCRLFFYTYPGMDVVEAASLREIVVSLASGEQRILPVAYSKGTYIQFLSEETIPLEWVSYIQLPGGKILRPLNLSEDGYDITVDSLLTDGRTSYVTLDVTLPETIEPPGEGWEMDGMPRFKDFWFCPADQEKAAMADLLYQSGSYRLVSEDGSGNYKIVVSLSNENYPDFTPGSQWKFHIGGLEATWHNAEGQAQIESKYAGQDYIVEGEEAELAIRYEEICWDKWDFTLTIEGTEETEGELELVTQPVALSGYRGPTIEEARSNPSKQEYGPFTIRLISFKISPLSYYLDYTSDVEDNTYTVNPGNFFLVMKDGREIELSWTHQRHRFEEPILLEEADYVLCPDGTKLPIH